MNQILSTVFNLALISKMHYFWDTTNWSNQLLAESEL